MRTQTTIYGHRQSGSTQRTIYGLAIFALTYGLAAPATASPPDPIDAALTTCLAGRAAETTAGMLDCVSKAEAGWDRRLNTAYAALMSKLDPSSKDLLRNAQRAWLDYRNKDAAFGNGPWRAGAGTTAAVTTASRRLEVLRNRVLALEHNDVED